MSKLENKLDALLAGFEEVPEEPARGHAAADVPKQDEARADARTLPKTDAKDADENPQANGTSGGQ